MKNPVKIAGLIALAIPFAAMIFMVATNVNKRSDNEYRFAIDGYDPRDLLRGHYLTFRYVWPEGAEENATGEQNCACIMGTPDDFTVQFKQCERKDSLQECSAHLRLQKDLQPFDNSRRFYIPEDRAKFIEDMFRQNPKDFMIGIVPQRNGSASLKELYIKGQPLRDFLLENPTDETNP